MAVVKKAVRAGAKAGKRVLATDAAQSVVGTVVDKLERLVVENADDVAVNVKKRAAKAGGRSPRKVTGRKKTTARKKTSAGKKTTSRKSPARKKTAARKTSGRKKTSARKPSRKKTSAKKR
jgi:DNA-binding protein HU-beta